MKPSGRRARSSLGCIRQLRTGDGSTICTSVGGRSARYFAVEDGGGPVSESQSLRVSESQISDPDTETWY
jgi:hypothetical protein